MYPVSLHFTDPTGYIGRIGVYEILQVTSRIREAIRKKWPADAISDIAESEGMMPLHQQAAEMVLSGITSMEEYVRISFEEE